MELEERAARIVWAVHRSMDWDTWGSKRLKYWEILTNAVRASAYTNSLSRFVNSLCSRMQVPTLGVNKADRVALDDLLNGLDPQQERAILRLFREEATTLVLQVRVWIEERRAAHQAAAEADDDELEWPSEEEAAAIKGELWRQHGLSV